METQVTPDGWPTQGGRKWNADEGERKQTTAQTTSTAEVLVIKEPSCQPYVLED